MRGVYNSNAYQIKDGHGPSPRAWGLQLRALEYTQPKRSIPTCVGFTIVEGLPNLIASLRSIPTCVGFTIYLFQLAPMLSVHPHVRGVYLAVSDNLANQFGPSPRAWGLQLRRIGKSL